VHVSPERVSDTRIVSVFGPPTVAVAAIGMRWAWQRLRGSRDAAEARRAAAAAGFLCTMLLYPSLSSTIFKMLRCRRLGTRLGVLEADYAVVCIGDARYATYRRAALLLVLLVPIGVPALLLALLLRAGRRHRARFRTGEPLLAGAVEHGSAAEHTYAQLHKTFGFCIDDFRPGCYWFEPVDLLRKLALTGLLQFAERGTAVQVLCGCCVAVTSLAAQLQLAPYRAAEANLLKALVDGQIFLTFLVSFILRILASDDGEFDLYEPVGAVAYGWLLLGSMATVVTAAVALTVRQECRGRRFRGSMLATARGEFDGLELRENEPEPEAGGAELDNNTGDYRRSQVWSGAHGAELPPSGLLRVEPRGGGGPAT
jgi:hypothetical protein